MQENFSIKAKESTNDVLDFNYLKQKGIEKIQQLAGKNWTDYNVHDPGITILENLCYAITELGYRTKYAVKDLLAKKDPSVEIKDTLFIPSEILPSQPITINDYRKILLDIEGVRNAFIYPSKNNSDFKGIYDVDIDLFPGFEDTLNRNILKQEINLELNMNRNLCEDFNEINFIESDPISLIIDLEISAKENLTDLYEKIYLEFFEYFSPTIKFYSLDELIDMGYNTDDIFEGPLLKSGFILDKDLERLNLKKEIFASDIIHFLMDIKDVKTVKRISIIDSEGNTHKWICPVKSGKTPVLDYENSKIRFFNLEKEIEHQSIKKSDIQKNIQKESNRSIHKRLEYKQEEGIYKNTAEYYSIQNEFPEVYGIGHLGLQPNVSNLRKAQAKQLKAFLLIFEQILANFFAQLENLNLLFSIENIDKTYFSQPLINIPGIEFLYQPFINECFKKNIDINNSALLKNEWKIYLENNYNEIADLVQNITENKEVFSLRRNLIVDHLLARLGFDYNDYHFPSLIENEKENDLISTKLNFLNNYLEITKNRGLGFKNIFADIDDNSNISGFEFNLNCILQLKSNSKLFPFDFFFNSLKINDNENEIAQNQISFKNESKNSALKKLMAFADDEKNFEIVDTENNLVKILLKNGENMVLGEFNKSFDNSGSAKLFITDFAAKIKQLSENSESIHIFERIFFRPLPDTEYFRFSIILNSEIIFNSEICRTYEQRKFFIEKILENGLIPDNYKIIFESDKQYKIQLYISNEKFIISRKFFESEKIAQKEIENYVEYFNSIKKGIIEENDYIKYYTKHYDLYNLKSDPYSFIITIVLPNWTKRFQNERFQKHIENKIRKEIPAHIYPDIKWLSIEEMKNFYKTVNEYQALRRKRKPDFEKIVSTCDDLFKILY